MADYLVIVESPAKAKTIGKFLGKKYKVQASAGHLRDLPKSKLGVDVTDEFRPQYTNIRGKADIINALKKEAKTAKKVFLATDPDREGEAISWHLAYLLGLDATSTCRVTFQEVTKKAVTEAFQKPRAIDFDLVDSYQARRVLDRVVGYQISPILWKKVKKGLSAGRVQSVTTRLICDREDEIEAFEPQEYWNILAHLAKQNAVAKQSFVARFYGTKKSKITLKQASDTQSVLNAIADHPFVVDGVKISEKKKAPAPPFTTSTLQQEASRKLGFTSSRTMMIAQQLYEGVDLGADGTTGLVSYIRTDSTRISDEAAAAAEEYIKENFGPEYCPPRRRVFKNKNSSQDAHEAIRPSHVDLKPEDVKAKLTTEQYKLYRLIYDRFIASQMADLVMNVCQVDILAGTYLFKATGSTVTFRGYTKVYEESKDESTEEDNKSLPKLAVGEVLQRLKLDSEQHFTQPPARYNEASLVKVMEEYGIGRPSTYAPTISTIQQRGYVAKEKKSLYPTELGRAVNELMKKSFQDIVDVEFTAQMESSLDQIEQGNVQWVKVMKDFYGDFEKELLKAEQELEHVKLEDPVSDVPCDKCGRMMVYKTGRFGKFLACPGFPECRSTKNIVEEVGVPCPSCGKMLIYRKTKSGRRYVACSGYPDCQYHSWNVPTGERCPKCGEPLEHIVSRNRAYIGCSNKECHYKKNEKKQDE